MKNKGNTTLIAIVLAVVVLLGLWWFTSGRYATVRRPVATNSFMQCVERGGTVTASYPRQCVTREGDVYTESPLTATAYTTYYDSDPRGMYPSYPSSYNNANTSVAYVKYPIASSTGMSSPSRYIVPVDSRSTGSRTSTYYVDTPSYPSYSYSYYQQTSYPSPSYPPAGQGGLPAQAGCYVGGCSNQVCSGEPGVVTTCEFRPEYACFQNARCERQANGQCGWTPSYELNSCLSAAY